jgi:predicted kinase
MIFNSAKGEAIAKEFNQDKILGDDWDNAWQSLFQGLPAFFGNDAAIRTLNNQKLGAAGIETMLEYQEAIDQGRAGDFYWRTMYQQSANLITAVGGSLLGVPLAFTAFGVYGTTAAGESKAGSVNRVDIAEQSKIDLLTLEKNKHHLTPQQYRDQRLRLEQSIVYGDLNFWQINGAATLAGIIEGGITWGAGKFFGSGTLGNARKMLGDLGVKGMTQAVGTTTGHLATRTLPWAIAHGTGEIIKRTAGEVVEETAIFGLTELSNMLILGNEFNVGGFDDVAVASLMIGGTMSGPSVVGSTAWSQFQTQGMRNEVLSRIKVVNDLFEARLKIDPNDKAQRNANEAEILRVLEEMYVVQTDMQTQALLAGPAGIKSIVAASINLKILHDEAGVKPGATESQTQKTIERYLKTLSDSEAKAFRTRLTTANNQRNRVLEETNEQIDDEDNFLPTEDKGKDSEQKGKSLVEKMYGARGLESAKKLAKKFKGWDKKTNREKLRLIHRDIQKTYRDSHLAATKSKFKKHVENKIYGSSFNIYKKKTGKKNRKKKQEDEEYEKMAFQWGMAKARGTMSYFKGKESLKKILENNNIKELKDLKIVDAAVFNEDGTLNVKQTEINLDLRLGETDMSIDQREAIKKQILKGEKGKDGKVRFSNGFVIDGKYITIDGKTAKKGLEAGDLGAGTVYSHEFLHATENAAYKGLDKKTAEEGNELLQMAQGLWRFMRGEKNLRPLHLKVLEDLGNMGIPFKAPPEGGEINLSEQSLEFQTEYINRTQDYLAHPAFKGALDYARKISGPSGMNILRGIVRGDFKFTKPKDSMSYLVDFIDSFDASKVSKKIQRKIKAKTKAGDTSVVSDKVRKSRSDYSVETEIVNDLATGWTNEQWATMGADFAIATLIDEKILDGLIASKLKVPMTPARTAEFIKKVYAELTPHIKRFKPEFNDSLFGWINSQIANKAGNVYNREYKVEQRTQDIDARTEDGQLRVQVEADVSSEQEFIDKIGLNENQSIKYSKLRRDLNLTEDMILKVRNAVIKTFGTKLPGIETRQFKAELQKRFRTELKKAIQDTIGSRADYDQFLQENFDAIFKALPVETLVQMERTVAPENRIFTESRRITKPTEVDKLISEGRLPKGTNRLSGPQLHTKKRSPSLAKVLAFFRGSNMLAELGYEVGSSTLGTRKDKLAMEIGVELAFDATSEILMDPDIQAKRQGILELQGVLQAENELAIIAKQIDRDPNIRFSRQVNNNATELGRALYYSNRSEFLSNIAKEGVFTIQSVRRAYDETFEEKILDEDGNNLRTKITNEVHRLLTPYSNILTEDYVKQGRPVTEMMTVEEFVQLEDLDANSNVAIAQFLGLPKSMSSYFSNPTQKTKYRGYINDIFTERITQLKETGLTETQAREQAVSEAIRFKYFLDNTAKGDPARAMAFDNKSDFVKNLIAKIIPGAHTYIISTKKESKTVIIKNKKGDVITEIDLGRDVEQKVTQDMVDGKVTKEEFKTRENAAKENWDFVNNIMELGVRLAKESEGKYSNIEVGMLSAGFLGNMKTPLRAAAELRYVPNNISDRNIKNYRYEHGIPAKVIMMHLLDHHLNGNTIDLDLLKESYVVGVVSKKMDTNFGRVFKERMQFGYKLGDSPLKRWFNELTVRGDLHTLLDLKTNKVVGEGHTKMSNMILETKEQRDQRIVIEEAHNQVNTTIRKSRASKGLAVFDFDDTMAFTKSGVRGRVPNSDGKPKPRKKVIFLAGGAGSGKSNVVNKLGLEEQGFKIVNQDISLEWLKKNHGLPENMNDLNKEQRSLLGKLGHQARGIAKRKMMKFQGRGDGVIVDGTGASLKNMQKLAAEFEAKGYDVSMIFVETSLDVALDRNAARKERSLLDIIVRKNHESVMNNKAEFKKLFGERFMEINTDNLSLEDQMPTELVDKVNNFTTSYEKVRLNAEEFATQGQEILERGGEFDFSEFNDVVDGTPGPLIQKALKLAKEHGTKDIFILTARPAEAAPAIHEFLKSQGLNIPIENITGLADSRANAKAEWMLGKFAEGYNDMYFVDDAIQNVEAVQTALQQLDIKSKVVQVRMSRTVDNDFNDILEQVKGMDSKTVVSKYEAKNLGKGKGIFERLKRQDFFFVPPSAEDFKGLIYNFIGKGKEGEAQMKWFKENLFDPFSKGIRALNTTLQTMTNEYDALKKEFKNVNLRQEIMGGRFTNDIAIRVYLWNKAGYEIPGLNKNDLSDLIYHVQTNENLLSFADGLSIISRQDVYVEPSQNWMVETIASELNSLSKGNIRKKLLADWIEQKNIIFSEKNLNKIEALYGTDFREALENILYRMEHGTNRLTGKDGPVNTMLNWINGSVGAVMFVNVRSAMLQTISTVNFLNFEDNNIFAAAKAFANPKQFWGDFSMIFNSDQLKQRRGGLQMDVSASELTNQFEESGYTPTTFIRYMLEKGFLPTRIADSFAIAFGGASFFRNRFNMYKKQGMSEAKAKEQAWLDFQEIAEETQQSSRPDLISQQQAGPLGRLILAWQNTPMQMTRLTKKALSDLVNRRGSVKGNISRIMYYGFIQNIIFGSLQSALAMIMWGDDEEAIKEREKRVLNGALDTILRGTGIYGAAVSTVKNTYIEWQEQRKKKYGQRQDYKIMQELINLSPPIGSKFRKVMNAIKTEEFNKGVSKEIGFRIENPTLSIVANLIEAATNAPVARLLSKANNLEEAITGNHELWQRLALGLGWNRWDVGVKDEELEEAKSKAKEQRKIDKKINKEKEKQKEIEDLKKQGFKEVQCSGIRSNGERCKMKNFTKEKTWKCQHHAEFKDGMDRDGDGLKEYRCTATTSSGSRCKNKTENKNKKCYAHQ